MSQRSSATLTGTSIQWIERGLVPDALVRAGIRRLCEQRLQQIRADDAAAASDLTEQFVAAAAALDGDRLDEVLDRMFALASFEVVIGTYVSPAMRALGDAWESGQASVAGEHLASHAVGRRLAATCAPSSTSCRTRPSCAHASPSCS